MRLFRAGAEMAARIPHGFDAAEVEAEFPGFRTSRAGSLGRPCRGITV